MSRSGRELLAELDNALATVRDEFRGLDIELQSASASLARNQRREAGIYRDLAQQRLADIAAERFVDAVDAADRRAGELLQQRDTELATLEQAIAASQQRLEEIRAQRHAALGDLERAEQELEALLSEVDESLVDDTDYQRQTAAVQEALETAANAEAKTVEAQSRREEKKQPYEQDSLFMYLWSKQYGTSEYRAGLVSRFFDRMIARHIRFEQARRNYYALNEIPRRLAAHTEQVEKKAASLMQALLEYERSKDVAAGSEPLEQALDAAQQTLADIDRKLEANEQAFDDNIARREQYATATDPLFRQAMQALQEQFRAEPVPQLRREAALTSNIDDDALVEQLAELRDEQQRLEHYLNDHRDLHTRRANRVNELNTIRRRYRDRNYDAGNSRFDGEGKVELMLNEFLRGLVSSEQLWQAIRHAQRFRRSRTSQSRGGVSVGGVRIPRMPRSVRLPRGGGFGSGGGFGGGGFRTKGGF